MIDKWIFNEVVPPEMANQPLRFLLHQYWLIPKHLIFSLRHNQRVLVNGQYLPVNFPVHTGDQIQMTFLPQDFGQPYPEVLVDSAATIEVLYEDRNLIVINKRRGDKTHANQPGEVGATMNHLAAYLQAEDIPPYMIHRLDQETSGAIVFAKNPAVVPILVANIAKKVIQRTYLAWVSGTNLESIGKINLPIGLDPDDKRKRKVNGPHAVNAVTHYQVIREEKGFSLLSIQLETGRTHQIRVHMAAINHPIVGDPLYNPNDQYEYLLLHSWELGLVMPLTNRLQTVIAPIPSHFLRFEQFLLEK